MDKNIKLPHNHGQNIEQILASMPGEDEFPKAADVFSKMGDGTRLRILWLLCHCEECVSNISAIMGMSNPAVSHHLRVLKDAGLIVARREGKEIHYRLAGTPKAELLHETIDAMFEITCPLAHKDGDKL